MFEENHISRMLAWMQGHSQIVVVPVSDTNLTQIHCGHERIHVGSCPTLIHGRSSSDATLIKPVFSKTRYITRYNSLYNVTPTKCYVTGLKSAIFDNYGYFAHKLRY